MRRVLNLIFDKEKRMWKLDDAIFSKEDEPCIHCDRDCLNLILIKSSATNFKTSANWCRKCGALKIGDNEFENPEK